MSLGFGSWEKCNTAGESSQLTEHRYLELLSAPQRQNYRNEDNLGNSKAYSRLNDRGH